MGVLIAGGEELTSMMTVELPGASPRASEQPSHEELVRR
jgi:hypothetical protein